MDVGFIFYYLVIPSALLALVRYVLQKVFEKHWGRADIEGVNLRNKTVVITGAGSGIGFETAVELANRGATVIITGRTLKKAKKTVVSIRHRTFLGKLVPFALELSSLDSVRRFCEAVRRQFNSIDILVNNAGVLVPLTKRQKSHEGYEIHFAVNHLAHFLLTNLLMPVIKKDGSRIVVVSSLAHRGSKMNFGDLMFENTELSDTSMSGNQLYRQSKMANILFARELQRRLRLSGSGTKVYTCCPGIVQTNISRNLDLPWFYHVLSPLLSVVFKTPNQGCQTILHCALSKESPHDASILYRHCSAWKPGERTFPDDIFMTNMEAIYSDQDGERLWNESEKLCGEKFDV